MPYSGQSTTTCAPSPALSINGSHSSVDRGHLRGDARDDAGQSAAGRGRGVAEMDQRRGSPAAARPAPSARPARSSGWTMSAPPEAGTAELAQRASSRSPAGGVDVRQLARRPVHHRSRRRHVHAGVHVVPPEQLGAGEGGVAALRRPPRFFRRRPGGSDCPPQPDFDRSPRYQPLATIPMVPGNRPVSKVDLHGGRHRRQQIAQRAHGALAPAPAGAAHARAVRVSPTTLSTTVGVMLIALQAHARASPFRPPTAARG